MFNSFIVDIPAALLIIMPYDIRLSVESGAKLNSFMIRQSVETVSTYMYMCIRSIYITPLQ